MLALTTHQLDVVRTAAYQLPPLAALGLTAAACGAARRPRLRRRSAASRCAGTGVTRPKQEETLRGFKTSRHDAFRKSSLRTLARVPP